MYETAAPIALHRLTNNSQKFLNTFIGSNRARSDAFSIAIASALVNGLITTKDCTPTGLFSNECELKLVNALGRLNEMLRLDADKVLGYTAKLNKFMSKRQDWRSGTVVTHSEATAIEDFFGISDCFSNEDLIVIRQNANQISSDVRNLYTLFLDLRLLNNEQ